MTESGDSFRLPTLSPETRLTYAEPSGHEIFVVVGNLTPVISLVGEPEEVIPISVYSGSGPIRIVQLSAESFQAERKDTTCFELADGECTSRVLWDWRDQGILGLFGATGLQGRTLALDEEFVVDGFCRACLSLTRIMIRGPNLQSPLGTDFIALVQSDYERRTPYWVYGETTLHMSEINPYPLGVAMGGKLYTLTSVSPGAESLPETERTQQYYPPFLSPEPFEEGRPVEGQAFEAYPTWREARESPLGKSPPVGEHWKTFSVELSISRDVLLPDSAQVEWRTEYVWTTVQANDTDTILQAEYESAGLLNEFSTLLARPPAWVVRTSASSELPPSPAEWSTIPFWDNLRLVEKAGPIGGLLLAELVVSDAGVRFGSFAVDSAGNGRQFEIDAKEGLFSYAVLVP